MADRNIDIPPLFKYAFNLYRKHASFVIGVMTTYFVLGMVPQVYMFFYAPEDPTTESQIISIIVLLVQLFFALGFTKVMLYLVDDRPVEVNDLVNNGRIFVNYFVAYFIYFFAVALGMVLFILPGIYLAIRLLFYPYYIIEYGDTSFAAMQKSWYATENWALELFLFGLCVLILNFLGALVMGLGVIFTYPLTTMATAIVFLGLDNDVDRIPTSKFYLE